MNSTLFLSLVLAHIIGDFYLQTDKYCQQKETRKFKSWFLYVHAIIIGMLSWMIVPSCNFGLWAKSILRFKDTDTAKTEYVLAGTFLSFGIAILCGLMARI